MVSMGEGGGQAQVSLTREFIQKNSELRELFPIALSDTMALSAFQALSDEEKLEVTVPIVLDGADWAASSAPLNSANDIENVRIMSVAGILTGTQIRRRKFNVRRWDESSGKLVSEDYIGNLYPTGKTKQNKKKNREMNGMSNDPLKNLQEMVETGGASLEGIDSSAPAEMTAFTENTQEESTRAEVGLSKEIQESISDSDLADAFDLQKFNQLNGALVGYVTNTDRKVVFSTQGNPRQENGKFLLRANAPAEIVAANAATEKVAKRYYEQEHSIVVKETKPGKILGVILTIPAGGLVDVMEFQEKDVIKPNESDRTLVTQLLSPEFYPTIIDMFFGGKINEDVRTHGKEAGIVEQKTAVRYVMKEGVPTGQQKVSRVLKSTRSRVLFHENNYFPIKTYRTIALNGNLTEEQSAVLNESALYHIVNSTKDAAGQNKFSNMVASDRALIDVADEGEKITSKYFSPNMSDRQVLTVRPFFAQQDGEPLAPLEIPVKIRTVKDGQKSKPRYDMINTLDSKILDDVEKRQLASLYSDRFETIRNAAGDVLTLEKLADLVRRPSTGGKDKPSSAITAETAVKLKLGLAKGDLEGAAITFAEPQVDFKSLRQKVSSVRLEAQNSRPAVQA